MSNNKGLVKFSALLVLTLVLCVANLSCAVVKLGPEGEFKGIDIALISGQLPNIDSLDASPLSISPGDSSTIQWSVSGATDIVLDQGIGSVIPTGNIAVSPTATTVYTITATNSAGSVSKSVTISVAEATTPPTPTPSPTPFSPTPSSPTPSSPPPFSPPPFSPTPPSLTPPSLTPPSLTPPSLPVVSFTASPTSISAGGSSLLSWNATGVSSVTIAPGSGALPPSGTATVSPASTTTYTLTATNAAGTVTRQATVTVGAAPPPSLPVVSFTASPASISSGGNSTLNWNVTGVSSVTIAPGVGAKPPSGNTTVSPASTTTYTLTATNAAGTVNRPVTVTVGAAPSGDAATCAQALFDAVNALRASNGRAALARNAYIDGLCQTHAEYMAAAGTLSHDNWSTRCSGIYTNISGMHNCAENVLQNNLPCDANAMAQQWFTSPGHHDNMLDVTQTHTISGMGLVIDGSNRIWACQMFTGP